MDRGDIMTLTLALDPLVVAFYSRIATAVGLTLEELLADTLFKLAGELSLEGIGKKEL